MSKRNTVLYLLLACALLDVGLILARINEKPISYLHSWNQITTLAAIRAVTEKQAPFYRPQEVVTRLSWLAPGEQASLGNNSFTVYEEFPLYSIIVSAAAHRSVPLELISRCVSLIFWFIGAVSIYLLALGSFNVVSALTAAVVYLVSFPVLYYGQAVMADICMSSMMLVSVYLLDRWVQTGRRSCFLWGVAALSTAALFKSYAVFFVPIVIFARRARTKRVDAAAFLAAALVLFPVCAWHIFAAAQSGHQEYLSHLLPEKAAVLVSGGFLKASFKNYFRYLGHFGGVVLILVSLSKSRRNIIGPGCLWWIAPWLGSSLVYALFTADKLVVHDYYFLPIFLPLFIFAANAMLIAWDTAAAYIKQRGCAAVFALFCLITAFQFWSRYWKATAPNPDVVQCSGLIEGSTKPNQLIATWTDVGRYNALAYYSNRLAINIEETAFALENYLAAGASAAVVNLPPPDARQADQWLSMPRNGLKTRMVKRVSLRDFKGRERICAIYELSESGKQ